MSEERYYYAVGRRKNAIARVRLMPGNGAIVVNGKPMEQYFPRQALQILIRQPFQVIESKDKYNVTITVVGGGVAGQAGAIRHGISRAIVVMDEKLKPVLRKAGLITRDARVKERKKYGLKRARKAPQYTKR